MKNFSVDVKHFVKDHANQNIPLGFEEARLMGKYLLKGCRGDALAQIQSVAVLTALHNRMTYLWKWSGNKERIHGHRLPSTSAEQIAGICAAIFRDDIAKSTFGFLAPNLPYAMDNCGMGGDLTITANISTIAAFVAASVGIPMCKHGSPANADRGRHGSSDFINLCGINSFGDKQEVERSLEEVGFGYTEALDQRYKHIHLQTHRFARLPHMNDIIGPITNPLQPHLLTRRILGVNHLIPPEVVAEVYKILNERGITNLSHGFFIRGFGDDPTSGGVDEASICRGGTQVAELKDGKITEWWLQPEDFGLEAVPSRTISPPKGTSKGEFSLKILKGGGPKEASQMVSANAALLLLLGGRSSDLKECYQESAEILRSGQAFKKMGEVKEALPE